MNWYYVKDGQQAGPVNDVQLQQLVAGGDVNESTLVWREGLTDWVAYGSFGQVTGSAAAVSAPPAGNAACRVCQRAFPASEMVPYANTYVCSTCKPDFFQRIQEGAALSDGNTPNGELMAKAREALAGRWGLAIGAFLLMMVLSIVAQILPLIGIVIGILVTGPLTLGMAMFTLALARQDEAVRVGMIFDGFGRFGSAIGAYILMNIFILLWALLLIVPGIMAALSYSMTYYVLADNPGIGPLEAINRSKKMMRGKRWKLFCLGLRFVGWMLLGMLALFIGLLWVTPYYMTSIAFFYEDVKGRASE